MVQESRIFAEPVDVDPFAGVTSADGRAWVEEYSGEADLPRQVKLGFIAYSACTTDFSARFDEVKLTRP